MRGAAAAQAHRCVGHQHRPAWRIGTQAARLNRRSTEPVLALAHHVTRADTNTQARLAAADRQPASHRLQSSCRIETGYDVVTLIERDAADRRGAPPSGEQIGRMAAAVLVGGFSELLVAWLDGRIDISRQQLIDDASELFLALVETAAAISARRERTDAVKPRM